MSKLKIELRMLLSSLNQFLKLIPDQAKLKKAQDSISTVLKKYNPDDPVQLPKLHQELQYKYNFFKLAYPFVIPKTAEELRIEEAKRGKKEGPEGKVESDVHIDVRFDYNLWWNQIVGTETEGGETKGQEQGKGEEELKTGTYIMKDGKLIPGESPRRKLVDFSNWVAANVDPEDLRRHRELLDRQHFKGPVWEGKKIPTSILDEENPLFNMDVEGEMHPGMKEKVGGAKEEDRFEKVKR